MTRDIQTNIKVCIIIGTRPEIIKMSPLIRACRKRRIDYFVLHTGQHYSYEMDKKMFEDLELENPKYNLDAGSMEFRKQVGMMTRKIEEILGKEKPDIVFVEGDTNSVLAGAIAASNLGIAVGHVEAGLRSNDLSMLEETNRIITDNLSGFLFPPTEDAARNLKEECIKGNVFLTGNTIVDAVLQNLEIADKKVDILNKLKLKKGGYMTVTAHRAENVDVRERLQGILDGLSLVSMEFNMPVIYPIHPRTEKMIEEFGISRPKNITFIKPLGFLEFLQLEAGSSLMITDSGGVQEEACILKVPCVTVRDNTERPETVQLGMNALSGTDPQKILSSARNMLKKRISWKNPFGDGDAAEKILDITMKWLSK